MIKSTYITDLKKRVKKAYFCNCYKCGRLHIWSQKTISLLMSSTPQYYCSECRALNNINREDLM